MAEILCTMLQTTDMQTCWSTSCQRELKLMWVWGRGFGGWLDGWKWWGGGREGGSSAVSDVFIVLFTFPVCFWLAIAKVIPLQSDLCSHCVLALVQLWNISPRPLQTFVQLEQCASYRGSRWILSGRQYAPNKQCALNNNVHLITRFYGISSDQSPPTTPPQILGNVLSLWASLSE